MDRTECSILRFGETLKVFDPEAVRKGRVIYEDLGQVLGADGLDHILAAVEHYLKELRPGIVVIDSFRGFQAVSGDTTSFRRFLYGLTRLFSASATSALWNAPYARGQALDAAEFAVADGIIALDVKQIGARELRVLQVLKLRGSAYRSGEHAYRITDAGFDGRTTAIAYTSQRLFAALGVWPDLARKVIDLVLVESDRVRDLV